MHELQDQDWPYSGRFTGGEHRFALRVYYEDTDAGGVVYHANYLRFMERARSDMLDVAGIDQRTAMEEDVGLYIVTGVTIAYRLPAKLHDTLIIRSRVMNIRAASCIIHQTVIRDLDLVAEAEVTVAFVSRDGRPRRQPRAWVEIFERLKGEN